jgi:hypothetical protein
MRYLKSQRKERKTMDASVEIDVQGQSGPEYVLNITLTNSSSEPLTIYQHSLPWVGWYSMILIAVKTDAPGTVIDKVSPIDDPGPARLTIKPGETLEGKISLVSRFPGFAEALKERDVIVFWSYQFQPIDAAPLKRVGGYVVFPKVSKAGG